MIKIITNKFVPEVDFSILRQFLGHFWNDFGSVLGLFGTFFVMMMDIFGTILGTLLGTFLERFWDNL